MGSEIECHFGYICYQSTEIRIKLLKAIFWDNDGVLVNTETLYQQATKEVLKVHGFELTHLLFVEHFLNRSTGLNSLLEPHNFTVDAISTIRASRNEVYAGLLRTQDLLIDGVEEVLSELSHRYKMLIVTGSQKVHFDLMHEKTGILRYFQFVLTAGDYEFGKPHPSSYLKALERTNLKPENSLVIEDSERGLAAAKGAGLRCWVIRTPIARDCTFVHADMVLADVREVGTQIKKLESSVNASR